MYVGEGNVTDLIRWFRTNSDARFLGLFAAGDTMFDKLLDDVLKQSATINVILGSQIDLFLVGGDRTIKIVDTSRELTVRASPLTAIRQKEAKELLPRITHISKVNFQSAAIRKKIKNAVTWSTHELSSLSMANS